MGNYLSQPTTLESTSRGTKRIHEATEYEVEQDNIEEELLNTPKRRKLTTTSEYIYHTLYVNGQKSDVTIVALGREWRLHRVYLCQSGYFNSMFSSQWKEADQNVIHMTIPDENIDVEALDTAFGSLYRDEVMIKPNVVIPVLAAATLIGLDGLIQQCTGVMVETVSAKTVCDYHTASVMYGQVVLTKACQSWLEKNVMMWQSAELLREIEPELMTEVIVSPDLFVMQVEMDVYTMLKKWLYLQFNPTWQGTLKELIHEAESYFRARAVDEPAFLETDQGLPYTGPFRALRLCHVINDLPSVRIIEDDCIIPKSWLLPVYRRQWLHMLRVEQGQDKGPEKPEKMESRFPRSSLRCGRVLQKDGQYCWRWTGYNFGVDVLVSFTSRLLLMKRNTLSQNFPGSVSMQNKRHILYKMSISSVNKLGHTVYEKTTGVRHLSLGKDQEQVILGIDRKVEFPLHISCCFMVYTPKSDLEPKVLTEAPSEAPREVNPSHNEAVDNTNNDDSHSDSSCDNSNLGNNDNINNHHGNQDILADDGDVYHIDLDEDVPYF